MIVPGSVNGMLKNIAMASTCIMLIGVNIYIFTNGGDDVTEVTQEDYSDDTEAKNKEIEILDTPEPPRNPFGKPYVFHANNPHPNGTRKKVIATGLYVREPVFSIGVYHNADMIRKNFPGWIYRIYVEIPGPNMRYVVGSEELMNIFQSKGVEIVDVDPSVTSLPPSYWRLLVADDPSVEYFLIRDADARLTQRDAAAVQDWMLNSQSAIHCMRDSPKHTDTALGGGLWGANRRKLMTLLQKPMMTLMKEHLKTHVTSDDRQFLKKYIYDKHMANITCHDSVSCKKWSNSRQFPQERLEFEHVGARHDTKGRMRTQDVDVMRKHTKNTDCE